MITKKDIFRVDVSEPMILDAVHYAKNRSAIPSIEWAQAIYVIVSAISSRD